MTFSTENSKKPRMEGLHPKKRSRSRNWCFTDYKCVDWTKMYNDLDDVIRYIAWGKEIAPKTGKEHHQGWIQMINPKDMGPMRKMFTSYGCSVHLESCKGSELQNDEYCSKDKCVTKLGDFKVQGQRTDLEDIKKTIDKGGTMYEISQSNFGDYIRYNKGFEKYKQLVDKKNSRKFRKVEVEIHKGSTGTGKTRACYSDGTFMIHGDSLEWWDGYEGEKTLLIDEYSNQVSLTKLLGLLDGYQMRLPIKGGFTYAMWNKVKITTNLDSIHEKAKWEHLQALDRRINLVVNYDTK